MDYRDLGKTGVKVSPLALGTENFGPATSEADSITLINHALDAGINLIDTANIYGEVRPDVLEHRGRTETIIGRAFQHNGRRDEALIITKVRDRMWDGPDGEGLSRAHIMRACEDSLRRLQTDHIDVYLLHWPDPEVEIEETLRALDDLVLQGKVRFIGSSNFRSWQIAEAIGISDRYQLNRFVVEEMPYNMAIRLNERELIPMARHFDVALLAWSPLFAGFLTGKYRRGQPFPEGSRFAAENSDRSWPGTYITEAAYDLVELLDQLAAEKSCTIAQLALAWTIQQTGITAAIIGPRTLDHLKDNLGALDITITDEDCARINRIARPNTSIAYRTV